VLSSQVDTKKENNLKGYGLSAVRKKTSLWSSPAAFASSLPKAKLL